MNSVENLFVNTTNRFSAVSNIILLKSPSNFTPLQSPLINSESIQSKNTLPFAYPSAVQQIDETYEELSQKYEALSKIIKQANTEKQLMTMLVEKIFKVEQGQEEMTKRRLRRKKCQIQGKFSCKVDGCNKVYSSLTSLARHSKLKHSNINFEPPQHDYQIPPEPNSNDYGQVEKREETDSNVKSIEHERSALEGEESPFPGHSSSEESSEESSMEQELESNEKS